MKHTIGALVAQVPQGWGETRGEEIIQGLCRASRLLGLIDAHLVATASDLPALAVHAGRHSADLPSGFQLCQRGACEEGGVLVDASFLVRLARVEGVGREVVV
ncbi:MULTISPECIES: hypothetical protein [unclassified Corynebacterium]|uniref:hypothetical protein n=1 Tax=unclassified Corynebacterium TaxID=2624378 RepID=UPI0029C9BF2A|nr:MULTISPECIES: hypothetical protein [unclassified Corynebacterium]WPF66218.1 hypothetical protein OLX12_00330 [Corynebacterium sp. 22KM0430]WPF68708.1 hypothetical protein OLW90_00330 [Corynebacterium sp. 21KM1197]